MVFCRKAPYNSCFDPLSLVFGSHSEEKENKPGSFILDRLLIEFGCDLNEKGTQYVQSSPYWLSRNPDIARGKSRALYHVFQTQLCLSKLLMTKLPEFGYDNLTLAVISRSEAELRKLIVEGFDVNGNTNEEHIYLPLAFAFGWSVGMTVLLDAGADPFCAVILALDNRDDIALSLLLEHDYVLLSSSQTISRRRPYHRLKSYDLILSYALGIGNSSDKARTLLTRRLLSHRRRLTDLATAMLSSIEQRDACMETISDGQLLDRSAESVVLALYKKGIRVPNVLQPGDRQGSIYHDSNMTLHIAEQLYSGGFHSVDDIDESGVTPLQVACTQGMMYKGRWELILWYLDKGAIPHFRGSNPHKN